MNVNTVPDEVIGELLSEPALSETLATLWSSFIAPAGKPADTLRDAFAPGYEPPTVFPRTISFPNEKDYAADYTVLGKLGEGGMGVVFEAEQKSLNRRVALKMIRPEKAADPLARNCFFYEATVTAGLEHPGIVPILEFGLARDGRVFYAMKKASGVSWSRVIKEKSVEENLAVLDRVADVAAYAHSRGVIHRDLKPANILLGDFGEVWVCDWGVAVRRNAAGDYSHAHPGGTPQYMPPEMAQCDFSRLGSASDVYLLGAILLEIMTGRPPHAGVTILDALENAAANTSFPAGQKDGLFRVIRKAMADEPSRRYADAPEFQKAVRHCLSEGKSLSLIQRAETQRIEAQQTGKYELFQQAIATYDAALAAFPDNPSARKGRIDVILAYGRQALANNEFDLALSIVQPEASDSAKAAAFIEAIAEARTKAERFRRRRSIVNTILGTLVVAFLLTGAYVARYRYDILANLVIAGPGRELSNRRIRLKTMVINLRQSAFAGYSNAKQFRNQRDLSKLYESLLPLLDDCLQGFDDNPWETGASLNRIVSRIRDRMFEIEEILERIRFLDKNDLGMMSRQFSEMVVCINHMVEIRN